MRDVSELFLDPIDGHRRLLYISQLPVRVPATKIYRSHSMPPVLAARSHAHAHTKTRGVLYTSTLAE